MRHAQFGLLIGLTTLFWTGGLPAQVPDGTRQVPIDRLYDDLGRNSTDTLDELMPPEPTGSADPRTYAIPSAPAAHPEGYETTLVTSPTGTLPSAVPALPNTTSGVEPIPAPTPRRSSMANQPYTLAGILDDENSYIDCLCEREFCERMWQCAGGRNQGWGSRLLRDWDPFGMRPRNRDNSMQCWECSARQQRQYMQGAGYPQQFPQGPYGGNPSWQQGPTYVPRGGPAVPNAPVLPEVPLGPMSYLPGTNVPVSLAPFMSVQ